MLRNVQHYVCSKIHKFYFGVYLQGDLEKTHLHIEPIDMMNREKMNQLPVMQVGAILKKNIF